MMVSSIGGSIRNRACNSRELLCPRPLVGILFPLLYLLLELFCLLLICKG